MISLSEENSLTTGGATRSAMPLTAGGNSSDPKTEIPVALQLYTVRDLLAKNFRNTVEKVAEIGYDAVEFAGYGGLTGKEMRTLLDTLGLKCAGAHVDFAELETNLDNALAMNQEIGGRFIVCPFMPEVYSSRGAAGFREFGIKLNRIGEKVRNAGMQLCYHNHSFEFSKVGDKHLIEYLFEASDKELVKAEVDVCWTQFGGVDPIAFIDAHRDRCIMLHMKDMVKVEPITFAPVGNGILNMPGILDAGQRAGTIWYVVEQDSSEQQILDAVAVSLKNLRKLLNAFY